MQARQSLFLLSVAATGVFVPSADAQPSSPAPFDIAVSNLVLHGEFNPGGRVQVEVTVTATGQGSHELDRLDYAFQLCSEKVQGGCTAVEAKSLTVPPASVTKIRSAWIDVTPWLPKDSAEFGKAMQWTHLEAFVKHPKVQEDFSNNAQRIPVAVGTLPQAPYAYAKFSDREIDGKNHAKLTGVSRDACLRACSADPHCKSVDYAPSKDTCYTQHFHRNEVGSAYKKSKKYDHYARPCRLSDSRDRCDT